jgi:hypothetical protein
MDGGGCGEGARRAQRGVIAGGEQDDGVQARGDGG